MPKHDGPPSRPAQTSTVGVPQPSLIIADGDPLARRVVRDQLARDSDFVVVAEAAAGERAVELALEHRPDLVLMETALPGLDGLSATRSIVGQAPGVRVVIFSATADPDLELGALRAGASGFLAKQDGTGALAQALHAVVRGEAAISRAGTMRLIERLRGAPEPGSGLRPVRSNLTSREWEVLDLLTNGASTSQIADALVVTDETVYSHVKSIMRKLGVRRRADAVAAAERLLRGPEMVLSS
jgi:NarL family two-component system response regulator LiaR